MRLTKITGWERRGGELVFELGGSAVMGISFAERDILRLRYNAGGKLTEDPDRIIVEEAVAADCFTVFTEPSGLRIETESACVILRFDPILLEVHAPDGRLIVKSRFSAFGEAEEERTVLRLALAEKEGIYGLGQDPMGNLNRRGHERRMWNEWGGLHVCANASLQFYLSSAGYGLLLNNGWPARFAVGGAKVSDPPAAHSIARSHGPWAWGQNSGEEDPGDMALILENGRMDVFFVLRSWDEAIRGYCELTGFAPMPPKWALGYMQSKNRYRSSGEFLAVAKEYRRRGIPCDVMVLDWLWFNTFGDMEWDESQWGDPEAMLRELHDMGFHVMQAYHPWIYEDSLNIGLFREKRLLMGTPPGTLPTVDHSNPAAREEWWRQTHKLVKQGIDAYWIDMGEPRDHPAGTTCHMGSREHVHNLYSNLWAKGLYEGHRRDLDTRFYALSRTSSAGIQRFGATLWSNDIDSSWEVLRDQVPAGLGVCLSGLEYWCTDIGGFSTDERFSPELFVRWMQWGVFCPLFRTHGTRPENEPWSYGQEEIITEFIRLRYRLMPYIYSSAAAISRFGTPMMRALCLDFPDDETACGQRYEYMFGPSILVAPILEKDARSREVYLPRGVWYDFWTDERLEGGRFLTAAAPLSRIPLYIREGALIPMADPVQYMGEKGTDVIYAHAYGGGEARFSLYEDDGVSYGYETGAYVITELTANKDGITSAVTEGDLTLLPKSRRYELIRHGEATASRDPYALHFDCDLNTDGVCRLHITGDSGRAEAEISYALATPPGWLLTDAPCYFRKTPLENGSVKKRGVFDLMLEYTPIREALPAKAVAGLAVTLAIDGKKKELQETLSWGTGYVNKVQVLAFLDESNPGDARIASLVEGGDTAPGYARTAPAAASEQKDDGELSSGGAASGSEAFVSWNTLETWNCWSYIDLRTKAAVPMKNGRGFGYARFKVWSPEDMVCKFEFAAERSFALWANGEAVYQKAGMEPKQIPEETLTLKKGENTLLVRCAVDYQKQMSGREIGFSLKLLGLDGSEPGELLYLV